MQTVIESYLEQVKIGRKQTYKNLAMFPLLSTYSVPLDYLILDEALTEGLIEVVEVDKGGSVPELKVINKSPKMVLILDGEEIVGAKQNRIVNTTILIQANITIVIPVSCVEQGRWSYDSPMFYSKKRVMSPNLRAMKAEQVAFSIKESGTFRSDQGAIWNEISEKASRRGAESPSMAMGNIYEKEMPSIKEYVDHFSPVYSQVGAIFMINGQVVGMDSFGKPETFSRVFRKLVESYALDAIDWFEPEREFKTLKGEVTKFLKNASAAQIEDQPSIALGTDYRLESNKVTGFALALDDQVLHLSIFHRSNRADKDGHVSRMQRSSRRRRNHS